MMNKQANGRALSAARRVRHRGVTYAITRGGSVYRWDDCRFIGHLGWQSSLDARRGIDDLLTGRRRGRRRGRKSRQFGRILSENLIR